MAMLKFLFTWLILIILYKVSQHFNFGEKLSEVHITLIAYIVYFNIFIAPKINKENKLWNHKQLDNKRS